MTKNFIALGSNLIVRAEDPEEAVSASGIVMDDAEKASVHTAVVLHVGPEYIGPVVEGDVVVVAFKETVPTGVPRVLVAEASAIRAVVARD